MIEFLGHFHPLIVHLPIGFLLAALLIRWLSEKPKYALVKPAVSIILFWGTVAALAACVTGYFASISDQFDRSLVNWHMWLAIGVLLTSAILYTKEKNQNLDVPGKLLSFALLGLIIITSHLGGSLAHGTDYLTKPIFKILKIDSIENRKNKRI